MSESIPPELAKLLAFAKELGIDVEMIGPAQTTREKITCPCEECVARRASAAQPAEPVDLNTDSLADFLSKLTGLPKEKVLDIRDLAKASVEQTRKDLDKIDTRSLERDQQLRRNLNELITQIDINARRDEQSGAALAARIDETRQAFANSALSEARRVDDLLQRIDTLTAEVRELNAIRQAEINNLKADLASLRESHRKQISLLHKRVTKRKGEVAVATAAVENLFDKSAKRKSAVKKRMSGFIKF